MSIISGKLNDTVTYWEYLGLDSAGDPEFSTPVQISGRWEDIQEVFISRGGEERASRSIVYVDQDLSNEAYLYLGTSNASDPTEVVNAFKVEAFQKIPSVSGDEYLRRAML